MSKQMFNMQQEEMMQVVNALQERYDIRTGDALELIGQIQADIEITFTENSSPTMAALIAEQKIEDKLGLPKSYIGYFL